MMFVTFLNFGQSINLSISDTCGVLRDSVRAETDFFKSAIYETTPNKLRQHYFSQNFER